VEIEQLIRGLSVTRREKCKHISNSKIIKILPINLHWAQLPTRKEFLIQVSHSALMDILQDNI